MKTDQQNPNFGQELGPRQLTVDHTKPPVIRHTAADAAKVRAAVQAKAQRIIAGTDDFKTKRINGRGSP